MTETQLQIKIFEWANSQIVNMPELSLLHHIPNEGLTSPKTAGIRKRKGVKAGIPDLFLPVAKHGYNGFYIELKKQGGKVSDAQSLILMALFDQGYFVKVVDNLDDAINIITVYLKG